MKKLLLFFLFQHLLFGQNLGFFREDLTFQLQDDYFYVNGLYHFRNNTDSEIKTLLFYPIPQDSIYGEADEFFAICQQDSTEQIAKTNEKGFFFKIEIPGKQEQTYRVGYRQQLLQNRAEYILTTTQNWGKPFESANFLFIFPTSVKLDSISYQPDSLNIKNGNYQFFYHKKNFMPERHFIIHFENE